MNRSVTVAILVSVLGFCVIVAICFLTYKLKPRHAELEPDDSPLTEHRDPSTLSFSPPSTRRFVIRGGHAISASQTGNTSIRSGRNGLHSERQSNTDLRQVEPSRPRPPRKDVEKGIVDAVVESTLFMPERSSIVTPPVLGHRLSIVPEMSQISPTRSLQTRRLSWDVRQLLDEVRTDTPLGHRTQHSTTSPPIPTTATARQSQIYELPATPIPPHSPIVEPLTVASPQVDITSPQLPVEPLTPTSSHMLEANGSMAYPSPTSPSTPLTLTRFTDTSSPSTSTPGRLSSDVNRALLRSKYNISGT